MAYIIHLIDELERAGLAIDGHDPEWDYYMLGIYGVLNQDIEEAVNALVH